MQIIDNNGREVIHLYRPLRCNMCCCPCCLQELDVFAPPGHLVGKVVQEWALCIPKFKILNAARDCVLRIEGKTFVSVCGINQFSFSITFEIDFNFEIYSSFLGPLCTMAMCGDVEFQILSSDGGVQIGKITKQWSGLVKEVFTDADNFGISFPLDLDVTVKAVLLGACFLIDFMFFEHSNNHNHIGAGVTVSLT